MVKIYVRLCVHVLKHSHNLDQGVGGTMFLPIMIINITLLVHNQEEHKEESNQVYTKWNTVFQTIIGIAYTKC